MTRIPQHCSDCWRSWRAEGIKGGRLIERIALAYEAGRDGFWLARWLQTRGIEVQVIHSTSVAVSREHRRAKTDRLDTAMLMRVFLGWLRGERGHCGMVAIPTLEEEDAKRPSRERESLVRERTRIRQDEGLDSATRGARKLVKKPQTGLRLRFDFESSAGSGSGEELEIQTIRSRCGFTNLISRRRAYGG